MFFALWAYADSAPLTLDFNDAPVVDILNTIAKFSGHNLVLADDIKGTMTLHIVKMAWPQALQMVLSGQDLSLKKLDARTWYIGDTHRLTEQVHAETEIHKTLDEATPLRTQFFQLRYADPAKTLALLQSNHALLSVRGQVSLDERTATLIVTDLPQNIFAIKNLLQTIDVPVAEVEIEARIVAVNKSALKAFGVTLNSGQPNSVMRLGGINAAAINVPIDNPAGTLGLSVGKLAGKTLDLELQALEVAGDGKIISAPQLTVADNQEAYIEQGSEIPFRTATSSGATQIEFKKAVLGLKVTPQIMADGSVNLKLQINKDAVSGSDVAKTNTPIISTSEVATNVRVADGETLVLGGIYSEEKSTDVSQVPILGGIPGLGWLFKSQKVSDKYTDLIVFVTPKVLQS